MRMVVLVFIVSIIIIVAKYCFDISIKDMLIQNSIITWVLIVAFSISIYRYGKGMYNHIIFADSLHKISSEKVLTDEGIKYTPSESALNIYETSILELGQVYENLQNKLGILKSLSPMTLLVLLLGYLVDKSKQVALDWNIYTVLVLFSLGLYGYYLYDTYKKMMHVNYDIYQVKCAIINFKEIKK